MNLHKTAWATSQTEASTPTGTPTPSGPLPSSHVRREPPPVTPVAPVRDRAAPALFAVAGVATVAIVAFVAFLAMRDEDQQTISSTSVRPSPASVPSDPISTPTARPQPVALTFDNMRNLVYVHYADLPSDPRATWGRLDPHFTAKTDWNDYVDFWSGIASVTVDSITPRTADSVNIRLTYVPRGGRPNTEDRWLSFAPGPEGLRIYDSGRVGTVG